MVVPSGLERPRVPPGSTIAVWFSCGSASAVALKLAVDWYGKECDVRAINNPVMEEDGDNRRFLLDVQDWVGVDIESAGNCLYPDNSAVSVWQKERWMAGIDGAPCTVQLKKVARQNWEAQNLFNFNADNKLVLGFTADEVARHERFAMTERANILPVLIAAGMSKADCHRVIAEAGIELPMVYRQGFPNANCIGCVKASSPTYWSLVRDKYPEVFEARAVQSRELGARLVRYKGRRVFLDALPLGAKGRPIRNDMPTCGIFCEESA